MLLYLYVFNLVIALNLAYMVCETLFGDDRTLFAILYGITAVGILVVVTLIAILSV